MPGEPGRSEHAMERGDKSVRKGYFEKTRGGALSRKMGNKENRKHTKWSTQSIFEWA